MSEWDNGTSDPDDEFMSSSLPACKFETVGTVHGGTVTGLTKKLDVDPAGNVKKWDNGDPKYVWVFELDNAKSLWVRGNMVKAMKEALGAAKVKPTGTRIEVKYYADGAPTQRGFNPPKLFMVRVLGAGDQADPSAQPSPPSRSTTNAFPNAVSQPW